MTATAVGIIGLVVLIALMLLRIPVSISLMTVGFVGTAVLNSVPAALAGLSSQTWNTATFFELTVIPLFVLMGNVAGLCGLSRDLYAATNALVGHLRGGLAYATVLGCTGFAALSGSSVASALTMGKVALPEMERYRYDKKLAAGAVAAGGTLGILIPPSTGFVIYAILTEDSIGRLFLAGVLPGILLTALFMVAIFIQTQLRPGIGPAAEPKPLPEKARVVARSGPVMAVVAITIGGIYTGFFTPFEAAAVGAVLTVVVALHRRSMNPSNGYRAARDTIQTTVSVFLIIVGAEIFSPFLALTHIPGDLAQVLSGLELSPVMLLFVIVAVFMLLGMFLDGFAIMVLVLPIVLPIVRSSGVPDMLGVSPESSDLTVWFGVIMVIILEMALISPPVGLNVFIVKSVARDISMGEIYIGILPFWAAMIVCIVLLVAFPDIALLLPRTMIQ